MTIQNIKELLDAQVFCGEELLGKDILSACASDMMSDVLAFAKNQAVLITGLMNPQVVRTAEMMDMKCIVFVRSKKPSAEMIELAKDSSIALLSTDMLLFETCGTLFTNGLKGKGEAE